MKRTTWLITAGVLIVALTVLTASSALAGTSGTLTVVARVRPLAVLSVVDDTHVQVQANTPWTLTIQTTATTVVHAGSTTSGTTITLPAGTRSYSLAWN